MGSIYFIVTVATIAMMVGYIVYLNHQKVGGWVYRNSIGNVDWVAQQLDSMFMDVNKKHILWALIASSFGISTIVFLLMLPHILWGVLLGIIAFIAGSKLPVPFIQFLIKRRWSTFNRQLVDGLTLMSNALKSGLSINQGLAVVAEEMPNPLSQEFNLILSQHQVGVPLEDAFRNLSERIPIEDVEMFVTAVVVLRETGGNLSETFDNIVHTIRERQKVTGKISAMTRQGLIQGVFVTLMPFLLGGMLYVMDPEHIRPLFHHWVGIVLLIIMLSLQIVGGLAIKKIITIRV